MSDEPLAKRRRLTVLVFVLLALLPGCASHTSGTRARPLTAQALTPGQPLTLPYPRLTTWWPNASTQQLSGVARYDVAILSRGYGYKIGPLRALNPDMVILTSSNACEVDYDPANLSSSRNNRLREIPVQWLLTQVGTRLTSAVSATQRTLPVDRTELVSGGKTYKLFVAGDTVVIDEELAQVQAVDAANQVLTVQRGRVKPATTHAAGTRVAATVTFWPGSLIVDESTYCPSVTVDASVGPENWAENNARHVAAIVSSANWDGIMLDRSDGSPSWMVGTYARTIDPDRSNSLPASYGSFNNAWNAGLGVTESELRSLTGGTKLVLANGAWPHYDLLNGTSYEGHPRAADSGTIWRSLVFGPRPSGGYFDWIDNALQPNLTMMETFESDTGATELPAVPNYRKMRFGLCTVLLNDGFFAYAQSTNGHAALRLYWFDEYDNAGRGRGYLGQPLGPTRPVLADLRLQRGKRRVWRRGFEGGVVLVNPSRATVTVPLGDVYRKIKGTQAPTVNDGSLVTRVTLGGRDGLILLRPSASPTQLAAQVR